MFTPSNSGLRRLVEYDKRNSPLPSLSVTVNVMSYILLWCCVKLQTVGIHEWL
jgi:hypothetical protein